MVRYGIIMLALCLNLFTAALPAADTPRAFVAGSYQKILASHPQRPLLITFWSLDCAHCLDELPRLGEWAKRHAHCHVTS
jgi:thiol-disulfide isomerase/thioredoxin